MQPLFRTSADLPATLPVFPLAGALLLPRGQLPLNIFEPRYLAMVDDALRTHRLIGMIQPESEEETNPPLFQVGCVGKITQFAETGDGRYLIQLTGISRFRVLEEQAVTTPYRQCRITAEPFAVDFQPRAGEDEVDRKALIETLKAYLDVHRFQVNWNEVHEASNEALVNALAMMSPFGRREKQALLEAGTLRERAEILVAITEIELAKDGDGSDTPLQ
ncbi:LON peptidase substrate-binding domain-containing protein [Labrys monachus]|uniref:Lon protease-like protein n=1 Tax=Labrys monachus TaxID=217067 RepID=A0ABU0F9G0_9HYPH|nr:LON peptidase substrate-binding domain-containing protein [Labrys monachus]MDQ0391220.1 Lon protease-like protein [Labrys monachus]